MAKRQRTFAPEAVPRNRTWPMHWSWLAELTRIGRKRIFRSGSTQQPREKEKETHEIKTCLLLSMSYTGTPIFELI